MKIIRFVFAIIILITIFYGPWWLAVATAFIASFVYIPYLEVIIFGALLDALVIPYRYDFFLGACILLVITYFLHKKLALYDRYA